MKQVLVLRKDLGMRKGKMCAQAAHASLGAVLPYLRPYQGSMEDYRLWKTQQTRVMEWLAGPFKKITVSVDSEQELLDVYEEAQAAGLIACLITDSGLTEFGGVPTNTAVAIGPDSEENVNAISGELKLL